MAFGVSGIAGRATADGRVLVLGHMRHHLLRPHGSNTDLRVVTPAVGQRAGMGIPFPHTARSPGTTSLSAVLVAWLTVKPIINRASDSSSGHGLETTAKLPSPTLAQQPDLVVLACVSLSKRAPLTSPHSFPNLWVQYNMQIVNSC